MNKFINCEMDVLFEGYKEGDFIGHTSNYLMAKCMSSKIEINKIYNVRITSIEYPYLIVNLITHVIKIKFIIISDFFNYDITIAQIPFVIFNRI